MKQIKSKPEKSDKNLQVDVDKTRQGLRAWLGRRALAKHAPGPLGGATRHIMDD
jgi:hypothetical protein